MRWIKPKQHDVRIIKRFAWFPYKINGEVRWLETVYIKQTRDYSRSWDVYFWTDLDFVNRADYLNWKAVKKK